MDNLLRRLWKEESGQGMAEYGLILALVAIIAIAGFRLLGTQINAKVTNVGTEIQNATPGGGGGGGGT